MNRAQSPAPLAEPGTGDAGWPGAGERVPSGDRGRPGRGGASRSRPPRRWGPAALLTIALIAGLAPGLGLLAASHTRLAVVAGGVVLAAGLTLRDPRLLAVASIPATLLVVRAGGGSSNLSVSDLVLFVGTGSALLVFRAREAPAVRSLLWLLAVYQATTLLTVIDNPYRADIVEWFHEALLVGGSLVVGWVVGRRGQAGTAVTAYVVGSCAIAVWACGYAATHHFAPVYLPLGMQKNYIGDMLAFTVLLAYARPAWTGWRGSRLPRLAVALSLLGILASQSKQAMISTACGIVVLMVRDRRTAPGRGGTDARRSRAILAALVPILIVAYVTVAHEVSSGNQFNSVHQRQAWYQSSWQVWHQSPLVGVGLRWWYTSRFPFSFQPPNGEIEVLTSAGVIGLIGFAVLLVGALLVLRRVPRPYGTLALAVIVVRLVQGQLDIFWVTAQGSLPWLLVGVVLGVLALDTQTRGEPMAADARPVVHPGGAW